MDRSHLQVHGLERAKRALHLGQGFVGAHTRGGIHALGLDTSANDVQPVQRRLKRNGPGFACEGERVVGDEQLNEGRGRTFPYGGGSLPNRHPTGPAPYVTFDPGISFFGAGVLQTPLCRD